MHSPTCVTVLVVAFSFQASSAEIIRFHGRLPVGTNGFA